MSSTDAAWNDLDLEVLRVFKDTPLYPGEVSHALPGIPDAYVRTALRQNLDHGYLSARRGAVHTTYRITEAGRRHLANTKAMV